MVKLAVMEHKPSLGNQIPPIKTTDNKRARKISYMRRKESIKKKTMELSVLCGVKACVVCYGPNGEVETWPEKPSEVRAVIEMYRQYGNGGRGKRVGQFCQKIENAEPEIQDAKKDRLRDVLLGWDDSWLSGLSTGSLRSLAGVLQTKLEALTTKIEFLKRLNEMSKLLECEEVAEPYCHNGMTTNVEMKNPFMVLQPQQHMIDLPSCEKYYTFDASSQISTKRIPTWNESGGNPIKINGGNVSAPNRISATPIWPPRNCCYGDFTSCYIIADNRESLDPLSSETPIEPWNGYGDPINCAYVGGNISAPNMISATPIWPPRNCRYGDFTSCRINANSRKCLDSLSSETPIEPCNGYGDPITCTNVGGNVRVVTNMFEETNFDSISKPASPLDPPSATSIWPENVSVLNMSEETNLDSTSLPVSSFDPPSATTIWPENGFGELVSSNKSELQLIDPLLLMNSGDLVSSNDSESQWIDSQLLANCIDLMSSNESELPWIDQQLPA